MSPCAKAYRERPAVTHGLRPVPFRSLVLQRVRETERLLHKPPLSLPIPQLT